MFGKYEAPLNTTQSSFIKVHGLPARYRSDYLVVPDQVKS